MLLSINRDKFADFVYDGNRYHYYVRIVDALPTELQNLRLGETAGVILMPIASQICFPWQHVGFCSQTRR